MTGSLRRKNLISQHIRVAPIYKEMLGVDEAMPYANCRRRNRVQGAVVEAALEIEGKLGTHWAPALLRSEQLPGAVAAPGPRPVRSREAPA